MKSLEQIKEHYKSNTIDGAEGTVRLVTLNIGLMQLLGVDLPMCLVSFPNFGDIHIYTEDLRLVQKNNNQETLVEQSKNDFIN